MIVTTPLSKEKIEKLKAGTRVLLSGVIYTARDAAHQRLVKAIEKGKKLPFPLKSQIIYYAGPTPAKPGRIIGSAGPTTSSQMIETMDASLFCFWNARTFSFRKKYCSSDNSICRLFFGNGFPCTLEF